MENQPNRPWFRLASQARIEPPQPRPPLLRPVLVQPPRPPTVFPTQPQLHPQPPQIQSPPPVQAIESSPSPKPKTPPSSSSSLPPSPQPKTLPPSPSLPSFPMPKPLSSPMQTSPVQKGTFPVLTPSKSPKITKPSSQTPTQTPNIKPSTTPMSLSPSQLKPIPEPESKTLVVVEQKNMLSQEKGKPASPIQKATSPVPAQSESPKITKPSSQTPTQSPIIKPNSTLSPVSLPPSQLKPIPEPESKSLVVVEQKNMLSQEKENHDELHKNSRIAQKGKGEGGEVIINKENGARKKLDDLEELGVKVITMAGENKGAYMVLGSSNKKQENQGNSHPHPRKNSTLGVRSDGNKSTGSNSEDGKSKRKENKMPTLPMTAFVNNNVQAVNNSILFNSVCSHSDPGVHLALLPKPSEGQNMHL